MDRSHQLRKAWKAVACLGCAGILLLALAACGKQADPNPKEGGSSGDPAAPPPPPATNWPVFRGDPALMGVSEDRLQLPLRLRWKFDTGDPVPGTAAIVDGRAFIGSQSEMVYCLDLKTGAKVWERALEDEVEAPVCVVAGLVFAGSLDGWFYALDKASGEVKWKFETGGQIPGGPNFFTDPASGKARVIVGSHDNYLYCFDAASGDAVWKYETDNYINGTPGIAGGRVIFGGCDALIHQVDIATGERLGSTEVEAYIPNAVPVRDGIAYAGHYGNEVTAVRLENEETLWSYKDRDFPFFSTPAITEKDVIVGGRDKRLHCIDRTTGQARWQFRTRGKVDSSPVVCGDVVFVGSLDGFLYAVSTSDGKELWSYEIGDDILSSPAVAEGALVIGADDGFVYCFEGAK